MPWSVMFSNKTEWSGVSQLGNWLGISLPVGGSEWLHHLFCFLFYFFHFSFIIFYLIPWDFLLLLFPPSSPVLLGGKKGRQEGSWVVLGCLQMLTHNTQLHALDFATEMFVLTCAVNLPIGIIILEKELCTEYPTFLPAYHSLRD